MSQSERPMKIFALQPVLRELIRSLGAGECLVDAKSGSEGCNSPLSDVHEWYEHASREAPWSDEPHVALALSSSDLRSPGPEESAFEDRVKIRVFAPRTLEDVFSFLEDVGELVGARREGREKAQRIRAQIDDWCRNFYPRTKSKRVSFITSLTPLRIAGEWQADLISRCGAVPQVPRGARSATVEWADIRGFRPDVILISLEKRSLDESARSMTALQILSGWEELPAVRRGEVFFCDGAQHFHQPCVNLIESAGMLISAIAGLESGYITPRDSFYRLRWVELHRHRLYTS
jgi:hypothetical protein